MRYLAILDCVVCMGVFLSGCSTIDVPEGPSRGVRVRHSRAPQAGIQLNSVVIIDKSLQDWRGKVFDPPEMEYIWPQEKHKRSRLAVESTNARRTATGTLEVFAVLRNRTDRPMQLEGRAHFFDKDEVPCEKPSAWQRMYLPPQSVAMYKERSTNIYDVAYYYVEIREGR